MANEQSVPGTTTFLLVDDELLFRESVARLVSRWGTCDAVGSVAAANEWLDTHHCLGGLLVDVRLGDGSGLDVVVRARHKFTRVPSVVFSGSVDRKLVNRTSAMDARFLFKPFGPEELKPFLSEVARSRISPSHLANEARAR